MYVYVKSLKWTEDLSKKTKKKNKQKHRKPQKTLEKREGELILDDFCSALFKYY